MANIQSAKKRARQGEKRRQQNASTRSRLRTAIKKVLKAIDGGDKSQAMAAYQSAQPVIDSIASKGIVHRNKASRHKSRLMGHIHQMA